MCTFQSLHHLHSLSLHNCSLSQLDPCDAELQSVIKLDISMNLLDLPLPQLLALPSMESLIIGQKNITRLSKESFIGLRSLQAIQISNCPRLKTIQSGIFAGLHDLRNITIRDNSLLTFLPAGLVISTSTPLFIDAAGNGLASIDSRSFPWEQIIYLDLSNNPLHCDCQLAWLPKTLSASSASAVCQSPSHLAGEQLPLLSPEKFHCDLLHPLQLPVLSACLVILSVTLGCASFLAYRARRPRPAIADFPPPPYHLHGFKADETVTQDLKWSFIEKGTKRREPSQEVLLKIPHLNTDSLKSYSKSSRESLKCCSFMNEESRIKGGTTMTSFRTGFPLDSEPDVVKCKPSDENFDENFLDDVNIAKMQYQYSIDRHPYYTQSRTYYDRKNLKF